MPFLYSDSAWGICFFSSIVLVKDYTLVMFRSERRLDTHKRLVKRIIYRERAKRSLLYK